MGTFKGIPLWILLVIFSPLNAQFGDDGDYNVDETVDYTFDDSIQQHQNILATALPRISIIQAVPTTPVIKAINTAHNNKVCSTWGNFRFKNFDGDIFYFPGTCNYLYSSHCKSTYEDFNIQIRRSVVDNVPVIEKISMKIDGLVVQIDSNSVKVNGETEQLPFSGGGVQIEKNGVYLKVTSKIGLVFMWNEDNSLLLELDEKYSNQTCGLCGDYNSISINNEFISNGVQITETQFGNLQKMDGPTEQCQDVLPTPKTDCTDYANICEGILMGEAFSKCHSLVGVEQYIEACVKDLCLCKSNVTATCLCDTFAEYSRQCAHAGGQPENWRTPDMCPKKCPYNTQYQECGSPCADTCTNPERGVLCADHCLEGCFCPPGTVFDDLSNSGCVPIEQCSCNYNADTYTAGASYATPCSTCICTAGRWNCQNMPCPATCSIEGGSHITTYDQTHYNIFGDCQYVMSKVCNGYEFTVLAELRKCGLTESETCLKSASVLLNGGETIVVIKPCGSVYVNNIYTQLPLSAANITIFKPSSFYIIVETNLRVQVVAQLIPFMQVYVILDPSFKTKTCGLCGNFNDKQTDDFQTINGVIEGTAASFANTWKTQASCSNVKNVYENPCSLSVENEKYAQHWCGLLKDASGPFADCHTTVNPEGYSENCMFDTCNCEKTEDCLCAAISSYVHACAAKGVILTGWRSTLCSKYMNSCPKSQNYTYSVTSCQPTCRSLSEPDVTCNIKFVPVDGCTCTEDYFLDDSGKCVPAAACPCYYRGSAVPSGEVVHDNGIQCTCTQGKLSCIGSPVPACSAPMVYFDCRNSSYGTRGAECQKSCQTLDMECYSTKCTSGCVCPEGLVADGEGKCIAEDLCPCIHNDATYQPGDKIKIKCNTCTCKNRMWQCTNEPCLATCAVYGDGHYITFDGKRYSFDGDCEYTLAQDHCGKNANSSTFRVITENIPCGTTGTTCSKDIKVFLGSYEIILTDEKIDVLQRGIGGEVPYTVRHMGIYLVIEADNGLILMWDKKTSIFIKLSKNFEGSVCGLCGNYDGDGNNDLTTRSMSVVSDIPEFGNSWKLSPTCPDAKVPKDACSINPYRKSWALKQCSIISSKVFSACHPQVDPSKYYDACVTDSCACDTGGDCECFCTAIAAYAQACGESGVCVSWRTPSICPVFCDYYNPEGECEWHYKPCGSPCMKTCRNPSGKCLHELSGLEGCYPSCPAAKPFFDEDDMECVADCGCYDNEGKHYKVGAPVRTTENCQSCSCTLSGISCKYNKEVCYCEYHGKMYNYNDVIYNTTDGIGGCITAICKENGTIYRDIYECTTHTTTTSTPFTFTTTPSTTVTGTTTPIPTTLCVKESCQWSEWYDISYPNSNIDGGDFETFTDLRAKGYAICSHPKDVQCRAAHFPDVPLDKLDQRVQCNASFGLLCYNKDQSPPKCYNYEIKVKCCSLVRCDATTTVSTTTEKSTTISSTTPSTIEPTTTKETTTSSTHFTTTSTHKPTTPTTPIKTTTPPTTSTSTAVSSTTIISTTSTCKPICKWTPWIDVHNPIDVKNDGDFETYENIRAAGNHICEKPDGIQCRSEKFPEVPIGRIGQVVQCNVTFGLVCKNEEQEGNIHICLNYQVKVLCCDDGHCLPTTSKLPTTTPSTTKSTTTPTVPTTTSIATTSITTETTTPTPIPTTSITTETTTPIPIPTTSITTETTTPTPKTTTTETTTETTTPTPIPTTSITTETSTPTPIPTTSITTETTTPTPKSTTTETTTETTTPTPIPTTSITTETSTPTPIPTTSISTETTTPTPSPTTTETTTETTTPTPIPTTSSTETTTETTTLTTIPTTTSTTTETTAPTPISTTTSTTTHSTTTETTTPTPIPTTISEHCQPRCKWSTWLDVDSPTKGTDGGDIETYQNFLAKGKQVCKNPQNIECRAEDFPDISIDDVGQVVKCEVTVGLVCNNKDQIGKVKQCFNYQIKVLCCDDYSHCSTTSKATTIPIPTTETTTPTPIPTTTPTTTETNTPIPTTTSTTTETTTPTPIPTTTSTTTTSTIRETTTPIPTTSPTTTETTTPTPVSTTSPSTTSTSTVVSSTTTPVCKPICKWTTWIDVHSPVVGKDEGDFETYENIRAAGKQICKKPDGIECRSEKFPEIPIGQIGQVVQCDVTFGLVCKNEEQEGDFNVCLNYQVKVLCCDDSHCLPTTTELPTTTPSTTKSTTTPTIPTTSSTTSPSTEITPSSATTQCFKEVCDWSIWFDVSYPKSDFDGGDFDTFENIRAKGYSLCKRPEEVECRAERFPDTPLDELEQNVQCNSSFGLLCYNKDQLPPICYNYEIRVKCCKSVRCEIPTTETPTTSVPTTATTIRSTTETTTPTPVPITSSTTTTSTTRESTTPTTTTSTTTETTTPTPIPTTTSTTTTSTTTETTSTPVPTTTVTTTETTTPVPTTTSTTTISTTETTTPTPIPTTTSTTTTSTTTETTTPTPLSTTTPTTTTSTTTETTTPTPVATTTPTTPQACQPRCKWSAWLDVDSPTKGTDGGDIETYQNILAKGKQVCKKPQNIECRAEDFPDISIDDVGQVVQCDVTVGLVCNNKDQTGKVKQCYNYQIKVLCCDDYSHCSTTTTPTTTSIPATETTTPTPRFTTSTTTTSTTTETTTPTPIPTTTSTTTETPIPTTSTTTETPIPTTTSTTTETSTPTPLPTTTSASTHSTTTVTTPVPTTSETTLGTPHIVTIWTKTTTPQATGQEIKTTECKPNCRWSSWYDVDQPSSGITGGDSETYENIISKGRSICKKPSEIECRAVNFPGVRFDQIGQNVQCNVNFGLVCKNEEQDGELKMCYNYEIRVLCCDDYSHCETLATTTIPTTTPTTRTLTTTEPTTTTPYISTTLHCYCHVDNTIFSPGEVIYNKTDEAGCYFYAVCNEKCKADRFQGTCQTTTVPPPVTTTPVPTTSTSETSTTVKSTTPKTHPTTITSTTTTVRSTTSTTITTTPAEGCPPKKTNETWLINNCTVATCHGNNVVTIEPVSCPPVKSLTCANGFPPVKVYSPNGCCFQYECECVCSGWGDPHYITFDGTYYTFLDNCTYVLVQQITPKFDNFRVLVDNYFCDAEDGLSCPQSIMVYYKSNEVVLTRSLYKGKMTNRIRFNENWVTPGFTKNGITVTSAGINMIVEIPEIRAYIKFSGLIFVIKLPFSLFGYNTEGQCGTCSNNSTEDCRLPNGKIISDCSKMANHWKVDMKDRPCYVNPTGPPTVTPTPPTKCETSSICNVILSDVFAECHKMIPPKAYHEGCQFDACYTKNDTISCASIEIYASLCTSIGLCVDWRQKAGGHCPFKCPTGKVYDACGPMHTSTCEHSVLPTVANDLTEGCYCPAGTKLFNSYSDICVATCSCVGPDGMPKNVSEKWISNCQECVCEATSLSVQCKPMTCAKPAPITCDKEGSIIVERPNPDQPCCTINECSCNSSNCLNKIHSCPLGFEVVPVLAEEDCCPTYDCRPTVTCVVHDTIYQPGHKIPPTKDSCEDCFCTHEKDPETLLNLVKCDPIACTKVCEKGYTYKEKAGQCCGDCVQVACVMQMDVDQTTVVIQPGETWYSQVDKCSYFECNKSNEHFVIMSVSKECTVASESDCAQGYVYKKVGDQCCGTCVQEACIMKLKDNSIKVLKPGDVWNPPNEVCNYYECHIIKDVPNDQYVPVEVRRKCDVVKCETGYEYKIKSGECCGGCIKVACTMTMNDNITITLQPGEEYIPQDEKCISYTCSNTYEVLTTKEICPYFNPAECLEGTITLSKNGCCKTCETVGCQVRKQSTVLKTGTCQSDQAVELTYCEGRCKTTSKYSSDANSMQHSCSCCQEKKTSKREVSLKCLDGRSSSYSYIYVEECGCTTTECEKDSQTSTQQEQQVETDQDQQQLVT